MTLRAAGEQRAPRSFENMGPCGIRRQGAPVPLRWKCVSKVFFEAINNIHFEKKAEHDEST